MKVVLLENVEKIGKKYDIKEVADGFARNFLIPKNLAKVATKEMIEWTELQKEVAAKKAEEDLKKTQGMASSIDGQEVIMQVKIGDEGQLFESINAQKIVERLKEMEIPLPYKNDKIDFEYIEKLVKNCYGYEELKEYLS